MNMLGGSALDDRTVHGRFPDGAELVRYDRAGKWFVETPGTVRRPVSLAEAVECMRQKGSTWHRGRKGGQMFDARVFKFRSR